MAYSKTKRHEYYLANKEKAKEDGKRWYAEHPKQKQATAKAWRLVNYDKTRNTQLKRLYGITLVEYKHLLDEQKGRCKFCGIKPISNPAVDHDHKTNKVRGVVCQKCNVWIGCFETTKPYQIKLEAIPSECGGRWKIIRVYFCMILRQHIILLLFLI